AGRAIVAVDFEGGVVEKVSRQKDVDWQPLPAEALRGLGLVHPRMSVAEARKAMERAGFTLANEFFSGIAGRDEKGVSFPSTGMTFSKPVARPPGASAGQTRAVVVVEYWEELVNGARTGGEDDLRSMK